MVGGLCFLLLVSLTLENLLKGLHSYLQAIVPGGHYLGLAVFYVFDLAMIVLLFAMIFRYLPDAKIAWRDVWTGAALTAILFVIGKFLLGLYFGQRGSRLSLWRRKFADNASALDLLFRPNSTLWRRIHQSLCEYLRRTY